MQWWGYALIGTGGFFGTVALTRAYMTSEVYNRNADLTYPPLTSIVMPTYNEEYWIETTLQSLIDQNVYQAYPNRFEIIVVDSESRDRTVEIAERYTKNVLSAPRGKLAAKHLAIQDAKGDVIVSVDADTFYPPNWLNLMLKPFEDPSVVAVGSPAISKVNFMVEVGYVLDTLRMFLVNDTLPGRSCAFRKGAYLQIGGYNVEIDQLDVKQVQYWEEVEIVNRFKEIGKVVFLTKATVVTSPRLFYCQRRLGTQFGLPAISTPDPATYNWCLQILHGERM